MEACRADFIDGDNNKLLDRGRTNEERKKNPTQNLKIGHCGRVGLVSDGQVRTCGLLS